MIIRASLAGLMAAAALSTMSGCGGASDDDVIGVARAFYRALDAENGAAACGLLAPPTRSEVERSAGEPCAAAILTEAVPTASGAPAVEVYATMGQVRWSQETTFLTRYDVGWRVFAAGCAPDLASTRDADRYDCDVQGG